MSIYDEFSASALEMLEEFGATTQLSRKSGSVDPVTGVSSDSSVILKTTGIITEFKESHVDGKRIRSGDKKVIVSGEVEPKPGDTVIIARARFNAVGVDPVNPDGNTPIVYIIHARA